MNNCKVYKVETLLNPNPHFGTNATLPELSGLELHVFYTQRMIILVPLLGTLALTFLQVSEEAASTLDKCTDGQI